MSSRSKPALAEACSPSWSQRVRAGRDLASFAHVPEAAEALMGLLLDVEDTAVTRQTAEALARVGTTASVRLLALAIAEADDNQADWLVGWRTECMTRSWGRTVRRTSQRSADSSVGIQ
ncbi:HEAT repeat domain-containing protein [Streptomyces sp. NPDC056105]|uniref:HEAT repeat domain-containing protein n=1 Tax=Streptomyces sp. NPDC056105 TaxID=3345714 RepID=UPI0035DF682D